MLRRMGDLDRLAARVLPPDVYKRFLDNDPADHAPQWHELGLRGHLQAVCLAAVELSRMSGVPATTHAIYHDTGKIFAFADAVRSRDQGGDPVTCYINHESRSAGFAERQGLGPEVTVPIRWHALPYMGARTETILSRLGRSQSAVASWIVLCASDAVGKGFPPAQVEPRELVAGRLVAVAQAAGLGDSKWVTKVALAARLMNLDDIPGYRAG